MRFRLPVAIFASAAMMSGALADPIEGMWKRPEAKGGTLEKISKCGNRYCVTIMSGKNKGKQAGWMKPAGGNRYTGELTDIDAEKTYKGKGQVNGNVLKMSGCVAFGLLCQSENWTRQ